MLEKGKLAELRAIARSHELAAGSQAVPNPVVAIAATQGKTPPQGPTSSGVLPAPERKKLVLRRPKRKAPQVVQEEEEDDEETGDGLITKRKRAAPSSPPALQTPTPPSPLAPLQPVQATPWPPRPQWSKAAALTTQRTLQAPQHRSYLLVRVLLPPHLLLGPR